MNKKVILILIIVFPVLLLAFWLYALLNVSPKADINQSKIKSTSNQSGAKTGKVDLNGTKSQTGSTSQNSDNDVKIITVYMPSYFNNNGFKILKDQLLKNDKIFVKYKTFKDFESYRSALSTKFSGSKSDVDIMLVPSIWIDSLSSYSQKLDFSGINLGVYTNYLFNDLLNSKDFTFIPYSIDPFASFVNKTNSVEKTAIVISDLKEKALVGKDDPLSKFVLPVVFGINKFDIALLQSNSQTFYNYFLMLYALTYVSSQTKDSSIIKSMLDFGNSDLLKVWDYKKFKTLSSTFAKQNENCDIYENICVLANGFGNIGFGLLSDMDIMEKYFPNEKLKSNDFYYYNFIGDGEEYPTIGRGFMLNKKSKNFDASSVFLREYINTSMQGNGFFWNNTISAFNDISAKQRNQSKFDKIMFYQNKFKILTGSMDMQQDFLKNTKFLDVLKGDYSIQSFVENPGWNF